MAGRSCKRILQRVKFEFCADYCVWCMVALFESKSEPVDRATLALYLRDCVCLICDEFRTGWQQASPAVGRIIRTIAVREEYVEGALLRRLVCSDAFGRQAESPVGFGALSVYTQRVFEHEFILLAIQILYDTGREIPRALLNEFWARTAVRIWAGGPNNKECWLAHWHVLGQMLYIPHAANMPAYAMTLACCWKFSNGPLGAMPPELFDIIMQECIASLVYEHARGVASHAQRAIRYLNPHIKL